MPVVQGTMRNFAPFQHVWYTAVGGYRRGGVFGASAAEAGWRATRP